MPLAFTFQGTLPSSGELLPTFRHLATYQVLHITNKSSQTISTAATLSGAITAPSKCTIPAGATRTYLHWHLPIPQATPTNKVTATAQIGTNTPITTANHLTTNKLLHQVGRAYHAHLTYTGAEPFFTDQQGNKLNTPTPTPTPPIPAPTGKSIVFAEGVTPEQGWYDVVTNAPLLAPTSICAGPPPLPTSYNGGRIATKLRVTPSQVP